MACSGHEVRFLWHAWIDSLTRYNSYCRYVTLKDFIKSTSMGQQLDDELKMYQRMERGSRTHPGRKAVRSLLDSFEVDGPDEKHRCLVHPPLWESVLTFLHRNPVRRLPKPVLAFVLRRLFLALDFLHTECQIIHTGLCIDFSSLFLSSAYLRLAIRHQGRQHHVRHRR
jgi:hypothetical protein